MIYCKNVVDVAHFIYLLTMTSTVQGRGKGPSPAHKRITHFPNSWAGPVIISASPTKITYIELIRFHTENAFKNSVCKFLFLIEIQLAILPLLRIASYITFTVPFNGYQLTMLRSTATWRFPRQSPHMLMLSLKVLSLAYRLW